MFKKLLALFCGSIFASNALAHAQFPAYLEVQGVYSIINYKSSYLTNGVTVRSISTRGSNFHVGIGYQFTDTLALELGCLWSYWPIYQGVLPPPGFLPGTAQNFSVKHNAVYLAGKYGFLLGSRWEIYGKAGIGYVARRGFSVAGIQMLSSRLIVTPVAGAGILFKLTPHWSLDGSVMEIFPQNSQKLPLATFLGFGARYQFAL